MLKHRHRTNRRPIFELLEERSLLATAQDLGVLGKNIGNVGYSQAFDVNDYGLAVGESTYNGGIANHPFAYDEGTLTDLGTLGGDSGTALKVNSTGEIVGEAQISSDQFHGFYYINNIMHDIGNFGGSFSGAFSAAYGINNYGYIVGASYNPGVSDLTAFVYANGIMHSLGSLGGGSCESEAKSINDAGEIVGDSETGDINNSTHAFYYYNSKMTDLGTLGGVNSYAYGINKNGDIVGISQTVGEDADDSSYHVFLYKNHTMVDTGIVLGGMPQKIGFNDNDEIVAQYYENDLFVYQNGKYIEYGGGSGQTTTDSLSGGVGLLNSANSINNNQQIAGECEFFESGENDAYILNTAPVLPNITVTSATLVSPHQINFSYVVSGETQTGQSPITVGLYYSPTPTFDPKTAEFVKSVLVPATNNANGGWYFPLINSFGPDPSRPYVLVEADPPTTTLPYGDVLESNENDNTAVVSVPLAESATVAINNTTATSDNITVFNSDATSEGVQQTIPAMIVNNSSSTQTFTLSVSPASAATLSQTSVTLHAGEPACITITPKADSQKTNDVQIIASVGDLQAGKDSMTIASVTYTAKNKTDSLDITNEDTTAGMPDRIPPTATTKVYVEVSPNLQGSGESISVAISNRSSQNGIATIDGVLGPVSITSSGIVYLSGTSQTASSGMFDEALNKVIGGGDYASKLVFSVLVRGSYLIQSKGFSVVAIPTKFEEKYLGYTENAGSSGFVVRVTWQSDSGVKQDLDDVNLFEQIQQVSNNTNDVFHGSDLDHQHVAFSALYSAGHDTHDLTDDLIANPGGTLIQNQVYSFVDTRLGNDFYASAYSGYRIIFEVRYDMPAAKWYVTITKEGVSITANNLASQPGSGYIVETYYS